MRNKIDGAPRMVTLPGFNDDTLLPLSLLAHVTSPTYPRRGDRDPTGGADVARGFAEQLPNARLELMTQAGHAPWMDDPNHVAERVGAFVRN